MKKARVASAFVVAVGISAAVASHGKWSARLVETKLSEPTPNSKVSVAQGYAKLPLSFEPNRGQAKDRTAFLAHGTGYTISLRPTEALLSLGKRDTLRMRITGASKRALLVPEHRLQGKVNYLLGNDRSRWLTGIPTYARLTADDVYPGIDLAYYGRQGRLEYDFLVRPGASPETISLAFAGARSLHLERNGNLRLQLPGGSLRQLAPRLYQQVGGERRRVQGRFVLNGNRLGFAVGDYDPTRTLVIDPTLLYSTYLGGGYSDAGTGIAVDSSGAAFVTGYTFSPDFPTANALQSGSGSFNYNAFVSKLSASGSALVYSTYLGGSGSDFGEGIAVDSSGAAFVTGSTSSTDFPTSNPLQAVKGGLVDAFISKLNASGSALLYSTYLGGSSDDLGQAIALDSAGTVYITGGTVSSNFPTEKALQARKEGYDDAFVSKLNAAGSALVYSTYLGGSSSEEGRGVAVDSSGAAYVTGSTSSTNFPTENPLQPATGGYDDAFVSKLNATGRELVYSTYLGGGSSELGEAIAVDSSSVVYVTGYTYSTDFPTANALQPASGGGLFDAFISKLNAAGSAFVYSSYLGGGADDFGGGIAVDSSGAAYLTGYTGSTNFPTANALQPTSGGSSDVFASRLNASGSALDYSTYLGGSSYEVGLGIAVDSSGAAYLTGYSNSTNFPTANALQAASAGPIDAFVAKIEHSPTAVAVQGLGASRSGRVVVVRWRTGSESALLGFNLYRERRGQLKKLNAKLIAASGLTGVRSYVWRDRLRPRAASARYLLEAIGLDGSRLRYGPVTAR